MSLLSYAASIIFGGHFQHGTLKSVHWIWGAIFYIGGFVVVFVACMLVVIRRGERTRFALVDRVALGVAVISSVAFIIMCLELKYQPPKSPEPAVGAVFSVAVRAAGRRLSSYIQRDVCDIL